MYEADFGLRRRPFVESVDVSTYVALPSREAVLRRLHYCFEHMRAPAVVYGPPGSGKSMVATYLASRRSGPVGFVPVPILPAAELISYLADEVEGPHAAGPAVSAAAALRRLGTLLRARVEAGSRVLAVVDEAHLIDEPATFETLRLLLNLTTLGTPDLDLLLVGSTELMLRVPPSLADRVGARCLVGTLTREEADTYITTRLRYAGAAACPFTDAALDALYRTSDGLPRKLNRLADLSLLIGSSRACNFIEAETVEIAAREILDEPAFV